MASQWNMTIKPALLHDIVALPAKEVHQVMAKIDALTQDPTPDGKLKKQLKGAKGRLYRIRSGDYRIIYTFEKQLIRVLAIRRRNEATYDDVDDMDDDLLEGLEQIDFDDEEEMMGQAKANQPDWESLFTPKSKPLPEPITVDLLVKLQVPPEYHSRLLRVTTQDELLGCPGIHDEVLLQIDQYMFERPLVEVMQQPDLVLQDVDDLLRYKEGELISFLLKLSPEQEKYVNWAVDASGPTLVKGGPGTGKSTVALYRVRSMLEQLRKTGKTKPHLLFTTYTNALVKSSEQLLEQLLGPQARHVKVQTADKLTYDILAGLGQVKEIIEADELHRVTRQAVAETVFAGNMLQQQAQKQTIERMGYDYLRQELNSVIAARQLDSLEEYLATPRAGRKMSLNSTQRTAVWSVYERWCALLLASGRETWQQRRARVETLVEKSDFYHRYDAVVIDEAQDLDPSLLRLLVKLCVSPNALFVTADANQSIYGSGFTWAHVHQRLKFKGRTSVLRANYRSTREIGEAAQSYLTYGALEPEEVQRLYINNGPMPDVRAVLNSYYEAQLLASFFKKATLSLRLTMGSCAVLCPNERVGRSIAAALKEKGIEATFMTGQDLNLTCPGVKVLTLNSSKGLEFPIVALAGFIASSYPLIPQSAADDVRSELLAHARRTMFVGMTRAMRALLVIVPADSTSPLFQGFDATYWNLTRKI